jgi:hypothetical protein
LRRLIIAATTACGIAALAAPAAAPAMSECLAKQNLDASSRDVGNYSPAAGTVIHYVAHPDELIICVRECGPPTN